MQRQLKLPQNFCRKRTSYFSNLFDSKAVEEVLSGPDGLLQGDLKNKVVVDMTTHHFRAVINSTGLSENGVGVTLNARCWEAWFPRVREALHCWWAETKTR